MVDRVKPLKWETSESEEYPEPMDPAEDFLDCRGVAVQRETGGGANTNDEQVILSRDSSERMTFRDAENTTPKTLTELVSGSGGITESSHRVLDQLVHALDENYFEEYTYSGGRVTNVTVWETSGKLKKIREEQYSYSSGKVDEVVTIQYDGDGNEVERLTETYAYVGVRVSSVTTVRSTP